MSEIVGHISQVIGPVVDVAFEAVGNDVQLLWQVSPGCGAG